MNQNVAEALNWKQIKNNLTYAEAAAELGACIMHAAACEGKLDNGEAS